MTARPNDCQEKAPLERGDFSATTMKHVTYFATNRNAEKCFSTWQARYAMCGHTLYKATAADGVILYLAARWGMTRELRTLDAVAKFYAQIGGQL